ELGTRDAVFFREFRQPERGVAKRVVGTGGRAVAAPHGSADVGGPSGRQSRSVHAEVPGAVGPLWFGGRGDQPSEWPREWRLRTEPSAVQACVGAGTVGARPPGFC